MAKAQQLHSSESLQDSSTMLHLHNNVKSMHIDISKHARTETSSRPYTRLKFEQRLPRAL